MVRSIGIGFVRGTALFFGLFSLANAVGRVGGAAGQDVWWIDLNPLPRIPAFVLAVVAAALLIRFGISPAVSGLRRSATVLAATLLALFAVGDVVSFYSAVQQGAVAVAAPLPFSAVVAGLFVAIAMTASSRRPDFSRHTKASASAKEVRRSRKTAVIVLATALAWLLLFPLAHIAFFGTTDYARPADAVVVLGARVWDDGRLSQSLSDRVDRAIQLYESGDAPLLVMSGGIGANGIDEAQAMRDHAVAAGVDPSAVILDSEGVNTDATVRNTIAILVERGASRVLVVSQFYHLPRIKMAYRAEGMNVYTVPALQRRPIPKTAMFVLREVPAFWVYWVRGLIGG